GYSRSSSLDRPEPTRSSPASSHAQARNFASPEDDAIDRLGLDELPPAPKPVVNTYYYKERPKRRVLWGRWHGDLGNRVKSREWSDPATGRRDPARKGHGFRRGSGSP